MFYKMTLSLLLLLLLRNIMISACSSSNAAFVQTLPHRPTTTRSKDAVDVQKRLDCFLQSQKTPSFGHYQTTCPHAPSSTMLMASRFREELRDLFSKENTPERRRKIREEMEELEDADFLLADVMPKALVHERDYFRQETRVQAWDEYVLVSILCTSISYGALQTFELNADHAGIVFYEKYVRMAIQIVAGLAVMSGLHSTMVFSLSILYARTALGMERDPQYDSFLENTEQIRKSAFRSFSISLFSFAVLVVLVLSEDLPLIMQFPVGSVMVGALYVGVRDWMTLVDEAGDIFDFTVDE